MAQMVFKAPADQRQQQTVRSRWTFQQLVFGTTSVAIVARAGIGAKSVHTLSTDGRQQEDEEKETEANQEKAREEEKEEENQEARKEARKEERKEARKAEEKEKVSTKARWPIL